MNCLAAASSNVRISVRFERRPVSKFAWTYFCDGVKLIVVIVPSKVTLVRNDSIGFLGGWVCFHEGLKRFTAPWQFVILPKFLYTCKHIVD